MQLYIGYAFGPLLTLYSAHLFLSILDVPFEANNSLFFLCDQVQQHCYSLQSQFEIERTPLHLSITSDVHKEWPELISQDQKDLLTNSFKSATLNEALQHKTCAACARYVSVKETAVISCNQLNLYPL